MPTDDRRLSGWFGWTSRPNAVSIDVTGFAPVTAHLVEDKKGGPSAWGPPLLIQHRTEPDYAARTVRNRWKTDIRQPSAWTLGTGKPAHESAERSADNNVNRRSPTSGDEPIKKAEGSKKDKGDDAPSNQLRKYNNAMQGRLHAFR